MTAWSPERDGSPLVANVAFVQIVLALLSLSAAAGNYIDAGEDGCHRHVTTRPPTSSGGQFMRGVMFAVSSALFDNDGLRITSLGFHVDAEKISTAGWDYEIWSMKEEGYFCDDCANTLGARGDLAQWRVVSNGTVLPTDLKADAGTDTIEKDYFQAPFSNFDATSVSANGGTRSFYLTLTDAPRIFTFTVNPDDSLKLHDDLVVLGAGGGLRPIVQLGQGSAEYPFSNIGAFMYENNPFVGKVYYEIECPSAQPSASASPSAVPSDSPVAIPSAKPSVSAVPTSTPSDMLTFAPSSVPSQEPTAYHFELETGMVVSLGYDTPCEVDKFGNLIPMSVEEHEAVEETILQFLIPTFEENDIFNLDVTYKGSTDCQGGRRRLLKHELGVATDLDNSFRGHNYNGDYRRRSLPSKSSAMDVAIVITGDYRPPQRAGSAQPPPNVIGDLAEESINAKASEFQKSLKEKTMEKYNESKKKMPDRVTNMQEVKTETFEFTKDSNNRDFLTVAFNPELRIAQVPADLEPSEDDDPSLDIILILMVIIAGLIALFGAFLLYRYVKRTAMRAKRKELEKRRARNGEERGQRDYEERQKRDDNQRLNSSGVKPKHEEDRMYYAEDNRSRGSGDMKTRRIRG